MIPKVDINYLNFGDFQQYNDHNNFLTINAASDDIVGNVIELIDNAKKIDELKKFIKSHLNIQEIFRGQKESVAIIQDKEYIQILDKIKEAILSGEINYSDFKKRRITLSFGKQGKEEGSYIQSFNDFESIFDTYYLNIQNYEDIINNLNTLQENIEKINSLEEFILDQLGFKGLGKSTFSDPINDEEYIIALEKLCDMIENGQVRKNDLYEHRLLLLGTSIIGPDYQYSGESFHLDIKQIGESDSILEMLVKKYKEKYKLH